MTPLLVVSDESGNLFEVPELLMPGMSGLHTRLPKPEEIIPLPFGSSLFTLPGRSPIGFDPNTHKMTTLDTYQRKKVFAAAAFMAPAYTQILRTAYKTKADAPPLPLYAYTAIGWQKNGFVVAGIRTDADTRQDLKQIDHKKIDAGKRELLKRFPDNRLVRHLMDNCVCRYGCPAARNLALGRFEAPLPTSPVCNARCVGCLSLQPGRRVPCAQERITFVPTPDEIAETALFHISRAKQAVVSFGQGCEGEPLMQAETLAAAIRLIRKATPHGTINLNTNASMPDKLEQLFDAGLDSVRVSMNSARKDYYEKYFRPLHYSFENVVESCRVARNKKKWCSLNYFIFPGFTDAPDETEAFLKLVKSAQPDYIQLRNLNMDPEDYLAVVGNAAFKKPGLGLLAWMARIKRECSCIRFGYFNPPKESFIPD
ncbi:MAG: radical SAM protein [Fibrobacterota bacterium]